ncbi:histidine phosphatase family protein [Paracoccus sp. 11-3]|uniref:Histidine phosphatase family protein n=1 Tax=Paracoccus amoyensis TaxID=2760093 RepID=A0A926GH89_9RHOB|nr:histidine phosphatase family protein [Paracoccus amoyensis]MBC9247229.1 histidine phosphatase family protein [Paracoccus amoyensis]
MSEKGVYPDLYLIRHGETEWNAEGRMQGVLDSPLTPKGRAQAARMAALVNGVQGQRFSSPQGRALETGQIVFHGTDFVTDQRLAEIDIGEFTGQLIADLRISHPTIFDGNGLAWYDKAPGGEHLDGLFRRAASFLDDLTGPAIIITHGITLRMLRLLALSWPLSRLEALPTEQGAVHVVRGGHHEIWRP